MKTTGLLVVAWVLVPAAGQLWDQGRDFAGVAAIGAAAICVVLAWEW